MDITKAAAMMQTTLVAYYGKSEGYSNDPVPDSCSGNHLHKMLSKICDGEITGEKAHRWLGWVQGVMTCRGMVTLEQCKAINHSA